MSAFRLVETENWATVAVVLKKLDTLLHHRSIIFASLRNVARIEILVDTDHGYRATGSVKQTENSGVFPFSALNDPLVAGV